MFHYDPGTRPPEERDEGREDVLRAAIIYDAAGQEALKQATSESLNTGIAWIRGKLRTFKIFDETVPHELDEESTQIEMEEVLVDMSSVARRALALVAYGSSTRPFNQLRADFTQQTKAVLDAAIKRIGLELESRTEQG